MIRPSVIVVAIAVAAGSAGSAGERRQIVIGDAERAVFSQTCEYYQTRSGQAQAGSARRSATGEFVVFLAGTCAAAQVSLATGTGKQRARAALLLLRIALLRETIGQMNADRWGRAAAGGNGATEANEASLPSPVTPSGEFLIAHRMGLMIAYDAWLDSGVDFSLAFYR
ncbi:MAG: hypothetical protein ACU0B1_11665 [Thermohalobaculum sp.]